MNRTHLTASLAALAAIGLVAADASAVYNPLTGRFLQRDPGPGARGSMRVGTATSPGTDGTGSTEANGFLTRDAEATSQYADGMTSYQYVQSSPTMATDAYGLATTRSFQWKKLSETQYEALADGAEIQQLSQMLTESNESWECIWPVKIKDAAKSRPLYATKKAACGDVYDISNLTAKTGPSLEAVYVAEGKSKAEAMWYTGYTRTFATGQELGKAIGELAKEGATPLDKLTIISHGRPLSGLSNGAGNWFGPNNLVGKHTFDRARRKMGRRMCWFRRGATVRFIGCHTGGQAKVWADHILRMAPVTQGGTYGTNRWTQIVKGKGGRLLALAEYMLAKTAPDHPKITTPFVGLPKFLYQPGWLHFPPKHY